jgi:hypothetical protein
VSTELIVIPKSNMYLRQLASPTVKILVGSEKKQFSVHFDVICGKVPTFRDIVKDAHGALHKEVVKLPRVGAMVFELFMTWLYHDIIERPAGSSNGAAAVVTELIAFAEYHGISQLADSAMDFLLKFMKENKLLEAENIKKLYKWTEPGSRLRKLISLSLAYKTLTDDGSSDWKDDMLSRVLKGHKDALPDYIRAMRMQSGVVQVDPFNLPACTFHGHGKNEPCPLASKKRKREEND